MPSYNRQSTRFLHTNSKEWRVIRRQVLAWEALCRHCGAVATEVDHIDNDTSNNFLDNLQALCKPCHSSKTAQEQDGGTATIKGHDVNGNPLDPNHPWNKSPAG
jgi:5-methylcytosine-specific restriction protein A